MDFLNRLKVKTENGFEAIVEVLRLLFILIMTVYLFDCLIGLSSKIVSLTIAHDSLNSTRIGLLRLTIAGTKIDMP